MKTLLKNLSAALTAPSTSFFPSSQHNIHTVAAALMVDLGLSDGTFCALERQVFERIALKLWQIPAATLASFTQQAMLKASQAIDLYSFTQVINQQYRYPKKKELVFLLWQLAYADGDLTPLEEAHIRKIADLIHLTHRDFIRTKHAAHESPRQL